MKKDEPMSADHPHHATHEHPMGHDASQTVDTHDHGGIGKYLVVFGALCILTGASFFTYSSYWPFGKEVAWAFMMAVSCTKAMLVAMFFMHLYWEANWKWVLTVPASFMSIFLLLMLVPDVGWRKNTGYAGYSDERWLYAAEPQPEHEPAADSEHSPDAAAHH
jgi:cytochrome c oxidase subunit 4